MEPKNLIQTNENFVEVFALNIFLSFVHKVVPRYMSAVQVLS